MQNSVGVATGLAALAYATQDMAERKQLLDFLGQTTNSRGELNENVLRQLRENDDDASDSDEPTVKTDPRGQPKTIVAQLQFPRVMKAGSQVIGQGSMMRHASALKSGETVVGQTSQPWLQDSGRMGRKIATLST